MKNIFLATLSIIIIYTEAIAQDRGFVAVRREAKDHVALIIGNSDYLDAPLANPVNDAMDVAKTFTDMGFVVDKVINADKEQMAQAIASFSNKLLTAKAAVFYYAGHGVQVNGENYLIPIGKTPATLITEESQVPYRAINAGEILSSMERAKVNFSLIVLDACRNNPFKGEGRGRIPGLASINAPVGSLVMYATKAGSIASDGQNQRNSPFTNAFLQHVATPGLDVNLLPSKITQAVGDLTNGKQVPGTYMQLNRSFTFVPELSAEEEMALKETQLKNLKTVDAEMARKQFEMEQKKKEDDAILAKKQAEIDLLDKQIADLKTKTASGTSTTTDTDLDKMLEYVKQKEAQKKELEKLQKEADERRREREKELYNLKIKEYNEKEEKINTDLNKYRQIAGSEFGKDMAQAAWDNILVKYGLSKSAIPCGEESILKNIINPSPDTKSINIVDIIIIPEGDFSIGSLNGEIDETLHVVKLGSFRIMKHEVTFDQYDLFCEATGRQKPDDEGWGRGSRPVINVNWKDAEDFSKWLSIETGKNWRLPTEAEWEVAARGGQDYNYSGNSNIEEVGWHKSNSEGKTQPIGKKKPNGYGLYDMTGNVWEWCYDWYSSDYYKLSPENTPKGPKTGSFRINRGGSWANNSEQCRVANRSYGNPESRSNNLGFRLVQVP